MGYVRKKSERAWDTHSLDYLESVKGGKIRRAKGSEERGALTYWRTQSEGHVTTAKERERVWGTHPLGSTESVISLSQGTKRKRASGTHVLENLEVGTGQEREQSKDTHHFLENAEAVTTHDTKRASDRGMRVQNKNS